MIKYFAIIMMSVAFVFVANYIVLAVFQEPTADQLPPGEAGNVPAPINVGSERQTKRGSLDIEGKLRVLGEIRPIASLGSTVNRLWGQGRPGTAVEGTLPGGGECVIGDVKMGRSTANTDWDGAAAACPQGWWVCTASERTGGDCVSNQGGAASRPALQCNTSTDSPATVNTCHYWVADALNSGGNSGVYAPAYGLSNRALPGCSANDVYANRPKCKITPVWCCTANR